MQHLLELADKIPLIMALATVIAATIIISVSTLFFRIIQPASKAMIVAVLLAMSGWAVMIQAF
jgi:hypothetical protein